MSRSVTGSAAASPATEAGQPRITPLWLNRKRPSANGAAASAVTGMPTVADRTATSAAGADVTRARSANAASDQSGPALR